MLYVRGPCERYAELCGPSALSRCSSTGVSTYACACAAGSYYDQAAKKCTACSQPPVASFTTRFESCPLETAVAEGCFVDASDRAARLVPLWLLPSGDASRTGPTDASAAAISNLTSGYCAVLAANAGQTLFSTQAGSRCYGGANLTLAKSLGPAPSDCTSPCSGNATDKCGGELRNSLFSLALKAVCTTDVDAAGAEVGSEAVSSLAECRRRCAANSACAFVVYTGTTCSYRSSFLTGHSGVNGPASGSTLCPLRPTEDAYLCVRE
ncbi:hypothetical protein GPECTOR_111g244 [Gonium pectorale]|uniref:WSC domain-containing protein n=1 Tax=Gonium pectorale TaxID=33097 RepID=A0A150FZ76_GONPE|nr:hypothetical protein GPECTOR_111g244 [Gonium pectorale]|eukprot:KXZ42911.1 hypothetical protein GPECTOR_111g244 [Gonium pectorale]